MSFVHATLRMSPPLHRLQTMEWPLLADLPSEDVRQLLSISRRRTFARGEVVFHREDPADSLHLVVRGRFGARVSTPLGDGALVDVLGPGQSFGELALLGHDAARRSATVEALEAGETRSVFRDDFARLQREHPGVKDVPGLATLGYPIAEIDADGHCTIAKPPGSGGRIDVHTVKEHLVYEVHDPRAYLTPDVTADIGTAQVEQVGADRVRLSGVRGHARPDTLKVNICHETGWFAEGEISYAGARAEARARLECR